jgi:hypothetical protein
MHDRTADAMTLMASMMAKEHFVIENKALCEPAMLRPGAARRHLRRAIRSRTSQISALVTTARLRP